MDEMKFKIVSGGQTGIDQAALAAAVAAEGLSGRRAVIATARALSFA